MTEMGYTLSCEEFGPTDLVRFARRAEESGFSFAGISDHFHPWTDRQGHSPFVWSVIGGVATVTERLRILTGVTCPTGRVHPAIVAHAAATCAQMLPGRFMLGLGTGENLNEHILGDRWPTAAVRRERLEEAVAIIRDLWTGRLVEHHGPHFTVENARIYDAPEEPPPILIAASGPAAADLAARAGDGLVCTAPDPSLIERFDEQGGAGKPRVGQVHVCYAESEAEARRLAHEVWPNAAMGGELGQVLPQPAHYEQAAATVREEDVAETVACGPDPERHLEMIRQFVDAGFDHVYVHQIGPDQEAFFRFYAEQIMPRLDLAHTA